MCPWRVLKELEVNRRSIERFMPCEVTSHNTQSDHWVREPECVIHSSTSPSATANPASSNDFLLYGSNRGNSLCHSGLSLCGKRGYEEQGFPVTVPLLVRGGTDLMGPAVGVEVGQTVQALVVLRKAAQAQEEGAHAHVHQGAPLLAALCRQHRWDLRQLDDGLWLPPALGSRGRLRGLGSGRLGRAGLRGCGLGGRGLSQGLRGRELGQRHHHRLHHLLDEPLVHQKDGGVSVQH